MSDTLHIVGSRPQSWKPALQLRKLPAEYNRGVALQLIDDMVNGQRRLALHEQVYVVWHHLHLVNLNFEIFSLFKQQLFQAFIYAVHKNLPAVLRAPDNVKSYVI